MIVNLIKVKHGFVNAFAVDMLIFGSIKKVIASYAIILIGFVVMLAPIPDAILPNTSARLVLIVLGMYAIMVSFRWWISKASKYIKKHNTASINGSADADRSK